MYWTTEKSHVSALALEKEDVRDIIVRRYYEGEPSWSDSFFLKNTMSGSCLLLLFPGTESVQILLPKALFTDHNLFWCQLAVFHIRTLIKFINAPLPDFF